MYMGLKIDLTQTYICSVLCIQLAVCLPYLSFGTRENANRKMKDFDNIRLYELSNELMHQEQSLAKPVSDLDESYRPVDNSDQSNENDIKLASGHSNNDKTVETNEIISEKVIGDQIERELAEVRLIRIYD